MANGSKHQKKYTVLAWILLLVGIVLVADGLLNLAAGNSARTGEATLGGVLMIISTVFFILERRGADAPTA